MSPAKGKDRYCPIGSPVVGEDTVVGMADSNKGLIRWLLLLEAPAKDRRRAEISEGSGQFPMDPGLGNPGNGNGNDGVRFRFESDTTFMAAKDVNAPGKNGKGGTEGGKEGGGGRLGRLAPEDDK